MATYLELKQQAEKLLIEAEAMRLQEQTKVIAEIKAKMAEFGVTLADLGGRSGTTSTSSGRRSSANKVYKFRGPDGELWTGGRGRKPQWVIAALAAGKSLSDFAI